VRLAVTCNSQLAPRNVQLAARIRPGTDRRTMASLVPALDRLLGPLAPGRQAARSAPKPLSIVVFAASGDQGRSACHSLVADGGFVVTGITEEPFGEVAMGECAAADP
jgi:hypothetical protein